MSLFIQDEFSLTMPEGEQLARLEETIERGLQSFVDVGTALMVVRDCKLYRQNFDTFEQYCRERWQMGKSRVYQMIDAAEVVGNLQKSTMVDFPATERQARPLAQLEPEQQREAWARAVDTAPDGKVTAAHVQRVVDEHPATQAKVEYWSPAPALEYEEQAEEFYQPAKPHVTHNSGNNEWHTPAVYIEAARKVMGEIDLDPASNEIANEVVKATTYYTIEDDGLLQEWRGRVFMNPPYSSGLVSKFVDKLTYHFREGHVPAAIVLVNNATETAWFQTLANYASTICFPDSRIRFVGPNEKAQTGLQGQAFIYIGNNKHGFVEEFADFGLMLEPL